MKLLPGICVLLLTPAVARGQADSLSNFRIGAGVAAPELAHLELSLDVGQVSQLGLGAGAGPTWGGVWPAVSAEHRLYFTFPRKAPGRRTWFFRQGATYFPRGDEAALTLSLGGDLQSRRAGRGWTIDAGAFTLVPSASERRRHTGPAVRCEYWLYLLK